jgi:Gram-negative bacterial TonB protein C-terminal
MESLPAYRQAWRRIGSIGVGVLAMVIAMTGISSAQTWHWQYVAHPANSAPINAQSTVILSPSEVSIAYTAPIEHRNAVIESCRVALSDVQHVTAVRTRGPIFLVIQLKPQRTANCESGRRPVAAIPGDDFTVVSQVAGAINQACCTVKAPPNVARAATPSPSAKPRVAARPPSPPPTAKPRVVAQASPTPPPTPAPTPTPTPAPRTPAPTATPAPPTPAPSPSRPAGARLEDWVENQGLFMFVRVRNFGKQSVTIDSGEILDCKNVDSGCGPLPHRFTLDPYSTATIATVASTGQLPSFSYRYSADQGKFTGSGSSTKRPPARVARMSADAVRSAEAAAISALRSPGPGAAEATPSTYTYTPPRLTKRGSSRLGIGQTGTAQVRLLIAPNGSPQEATIVSITNRALTAAAIETAVSSSYAPAMRNGQPVPANYVATFSFNGEDPATADVPVWRRSAPPVPAGPPSPGPSAAASASSSTTPPQSSPH